LCVVLKPEFDIVAVRRGQTVLTSGKTMLYRNRLVTPILVFALIAFLVGFSKTSDAGSPREKIDGWGGYKFGMSLKDAEKIHADDQLVDCDFGKWAKKCLQREVLLFGEKAQVQALIDAKKNSVRRIDIKFTGMLNNLLKEKRNIAKIKTKLNSSKLNRSDILECMDEKNVVSSMEKK